MRDGNLKWTLAIALSLALPAASLAALLKPRIIVLTAISPAQVEPDDMVLWDESAWTYQNGTGKANWNQYAAGKSFHDWCVSRDVKHD